MATSNGSRTKLYVGMHDGIGTLVSSDGNGAWTNRGVTPLDHAAARFAHSQSSPERAYLAAYESGVWRTDDGGAAWRRLDGYPTAYAHSVAVHPGNPNLVYAGSEPAALFRSTDGGDSWEEIRSYQEVPESAGWGFHGERLSHVREIKLSPHDPDQIFTGIEVGGMVRSKDGGLTWQQLHDTDPDIHSLHVSDTDAGTVYAATAAGPYRSDDGGDSWKHLTTGLERTYTVPVVCAPDDHTRVLTAVSNNAGRQGAQAYISTNSGDEWRRIDLGSDDDMVIAYTWDPCDSDRVYAGTDAGRIFVSSDRGETWEAAQADLATLAVGAMVAVAS